MCIYIYIDTRITTISIRTKIYETNLKVLKSNIEISINSLHSQYI